MTTPRHDSADAAAMLTRRLRSEFGDDSVFIDIDTIPFGIDFREQITRAVDQCDVLLAIIGNEWLGVNVEKPGRRIDDPADFVRIEIEAAVRRASPVVQIDGFVGGKLSVGEMLECTVSAGSHQLEVIHPAAAHDAREQINVSPGQTCAWSVSLGWTGVKLRQT